MLTKGEEYADQGQDYYEERYRARVLRQLSFRAQKLGIARCYRTTRTRLKYNSKPIT